MRVAFPVPADGPRQFPHDLRFIGDIDARLAREIAHELDGITTRPFRLTLKGTGLFGGNKPHTIFAGVEENAELRRLHDQHERLCQMLGCPAEGRQVRAPCVAGPPEPARSRGPCSAGSRSIVFIAVQPLMSAALCCFPRGRCAVADPMPSKRPKRWGWPPWQEHYDG